MTRTIMNNEGDAISSVRIDDARVVHEEITVFGRHACAGTLVVRAGEADIIARRLVCTVDPAKIEAAMQLAEAIEQYEYVGEPKLAIVDAIDTWKTMAAGALR